jgi:hypothetical protein
LPLSLYQWGASWVQATPYHVKAAYVRFVNHCYMDTEMEGLIELTFTRLVWRLLENFQRDIVRVCYFGRGGGGQALIVSGCAAVRYGHAVVRLGVFT